MSDNNLVFEKRAVHESPKVYSSPMLTEFGTIQDITQGGTGKGFDPETGTSNNYTT